MSDKNYNWDGKSRPSDDVYRKRIESANLSDKQHKYITELAKQADKKDLVEKSILSGKIHKFNASMTINQLKEIITKNNKERT